MERVTEADYKHAKRVWENTGLQTLDQHHDLYVQSDTLLFADKLKSFRNCYLEIYDQILLIFFFFSRHGLERQACLQKTDVKLEFLTDADTLLMVENDVTDGIFYSVKRYTKANNKYMKDNDPRTEFSYLIYWDVNNLYGQASSQKLPVDDFKLKKSKSKFTQKFIQNYNNGMMTATKDTPLRLILVIPSIYLSEDTQLSPVFA